MKILVEVIFQTYGKQKNLAAAVLLYNDFYRLTERLFYGRMIFVG